ncbi:hypothetical protein [Halopenitus sp. POP-27]|uniref:hypothetical protein n=1 Tax=Halopenitus sp. POP-27 TaxID=2994425 RepID=UPI002469A9E5|nr:hypothetical protein [Halopenitus sp. POP-27]
MPHGNGTDSDRPTPADGPVVGDGDRRNDHDPAETFSRPAVTVSRTSPGKRVFSEADNTDGWIATDLAVEPER